MKGRIGRAVLAGGIVLLFSALCTWSLYSYRLQGVSDAVYDKGLLYLIDNNGNETNFFMADSKGRVLGRIDEPKLKGDRWNTYSSLSVDRDGQVYVCCYSRAMNENLGQSLAYRCDFENGRLELMGELAQARINRMQAVDGRIYYFAGEIEDACALHCMDPQGGKEIILRVQGNIASVKEAFYDPEQGAMWVDWKCRFYHNGVQVAETGGIRDYAGIRIGGSGAYYMDVAEGSVKHIPFGGAEASAMFMTDDARLMEPGLTYMDVLPLSYLEDGSFLAGVDISRGRRVLGIFDSSGRQVNQVSEIVLGLGPGLGLWIKTICLCLVLGFALYVLIRLGARLTRGIIPINLKLFILLIPLILGVSLLLDHQLRRSLEKRMLRMNYDLLYVIADLKLSDINPGELAQMDLERVPDDRHYEDIFKRKDYSNLPYKIHDSATGASQPVVATVYYWVFLEDDGVLRYGEVSGRHYFGTRVAYDRSRYEMMKMDRAMKDKTVVKTEYNDFTGDFVALYVPVVDENGRSIGVMESGVNRRVLDFEVEQQMEEIHRLLITVMAVLMAAVMAVLAFFLHPLARVRKAVEEVSSGNLGRTVRVHGRDEVAGIGRAFNHMSRRLREQVEFIQACSDGYAAFVPQMVLKILGREDITQIRLGDQKEIHAAVLSISSHEFRENARTLSGGELYRMINRILQEMIPLVSLNEGVVDHMNEDGLKAYYPDDPEGALQSAISICEAFRAMRAQGDKIPVYRACVCFGPVCLGIVGGKGRMEASTISELISLTGFLDILGEKYGAKILVLEHAAARIPDFGARFHSREIGTLYIKRQGTAERVYDVYDGDEPADYRAKDKTKGMFRKAMKAYREGGYYEARLIFARILKENGKDLAAREYVYRCDRYYQTKDERAVPPHLEEY